MMVAMVSGEQQHCVVGQTNLGEAVQHPAAGIVYADDHAADQCLRLYRFAG